MKGFIEVHDLQTREGVTLLSVSAIEQVYGHTIWLKNYHPEEDRTFLVCREMYGEIVNKIKEAEK